MGCAVKFLLVALLWDWGLFLVVEVTVFSLSGFGRGLIFYLRFAIIIVDAEMNLIAVSVIRAVVKIIKMIRIA